MSRNISQSSAWIIAVLSSAAIFGLILALIMSIRGAHERGLPSGFDLNRTLSSDSYEVKSEASEVDRIEDSDPMIIRSDDF